MPGNFVLAKKIAKPIFLGIILIVLVIVGAFLWWRAQELERLQNGSQLLETNHGIIEYTSFGDGPAVLVLHGTIGGYDQAQVLAEMLATDNYRFICVSRPGYLRTPLDTGPTFADQADAYAALLTELDIEQAAIMAISGGGPPALQFALRHPDRTWGLIMIATNSDVTIQSNKPSEGVDSESGGGPPGWLLDLIFSDFTSWVITSSAKLFPQWFLPILVGEPYQIDVLEDPQKFKLYTGLVNSFSLTSQRRIGSFNDGAEFLEHTGYPLETILTPILILQGSEDAEDLYLQQQFLDSTVPNSEFIEIEGGTHFMPASHNEEIGHLVRGFLEAYRP